MGKVTNTNAPATVQAWVRNDKWDLVAPVAAVHQQSKLFMHLPAKAKEIIKDETKALHSATHRSDPWTGKQKAGGLSVWEYKWEDGKQRVVKRTEGHGGARRGGQGHVVLLRAQVRPAWAEAAERVLLLRGPGRFLRHRRGRQTSLPAAHPRATARTADGRATGR